MTYEVEAYRVNMELGWRYQRKFPPPATVGRWLASYGCTSVDIQNAMPALEMMSKDAKRGEIISEASKVAIKKLDPKFLRP